MSDLRGLPGGQMIGAVVALALCVLMALGAPAVFAQDGESRKPEGRRVEALSQAGYDLIVEAQTQLEAENYAGALSSLSRIINSPGNYKGIDVATAYKFRGYAYAGQDNYSAATKDFEAAINNGSLPEYDVTDLTYNLAQLFLATEQYGKAVQYLERWLAGAENPNAQAFFFAAQTYAVVDRMADAENYADRGLQKARETGVALQENWLRIASTVFLQRGKYSKARPILEQLIAGWPDKKDYYVQLGGVYQELGQERDSFAVLALAYSNNLPLSSSEIVRLAQLYRLYDYPYKAAKILEKEIAAGRVTQNKSNWQELGDSWFQAREMRKAIQPLTNAARLAGDGDLYLRLCQTYASEDEWSNAARDCANAINKGGLKGQFGLAYQLRGMALYEAGEREDALEAMAKCEEYENTEDNCRAWIKHITNEIAEEEAEAERKRLAEAAAEERRLEQEEEIRRTLREVENLGRQAGREGNLDDGGGADAPATDAPAEDASAEEGASE